MERDAVWAACAIGSICGYGFDFRVQRYLDAFENARQEATATTSRCLIMHAMLQDYLGHHAQAIETFNVAMEAAQV